MIWLTWRQFRAQAVTAAVALAAFAALLGTTRPHMDTLYSASGIPGCQGGSCPGLASAFLNQLASAAPFSGHSFDPLPAGFDLYPFVYMLAILLTLASPAIAGVFWGAPLIARELETGTFRLAWSQGVTRNRWLAVKLALVGAAAVAVTEVFSLLLAWWATPVGRAMALGGDASVFSGNRFSPLAFVTYGITPAGYAAFGFALGVTAGLLIRRTIPALASTLAVFAVIQIVMPLWVRPHLIPPQHASIAIGRDVTLADDSPGSGGGAGFALTTGGVPGQPGAWITASGAVGADRQPVTTAPPACAEDLDSKSGLDCLASHGVRIAVSYQPASRYWALQSAETGLFLTLTLVLAGFCFWRLGRRRS